MSEINTGDIMLDAVINMPYEMAMATELSCSQFYSRAHQALEKLAASQERVRELEEKLKLSEAVSDCLGRQVQIKDDDRIFFRDKLAAVEQERVALAKDAERLDWMHVQDFDCLSFSLVVDRPHDGEVELQWTDNKNTERVVYGKTLRDAIDAAIDSGRDAT